MTTVLKFKRIIEGEYQSEFKGFQVEISKNYEARNWSLIVYDPQGSMIFDDVCYTYKEAKKFANLTIIDNA